MLENVALLQAHYPLFAPTVAFLFGAEWICDEECQRLDPLNVSEATDVVATHGNELVELEAMCLEIASGAGEVGRQIGARSRLTKRMRDKAC